MDVIEMTNEEAIHALLADIYRQSLMVAGESQRLKAENDRLKADNERLRSAGVSDDA